MIDLNVLDNGALQYTQNYYFGLCMLLEFFSITMFHKLNVSIIRSEEGKLSAELGHRKKLNSAQNHFPNGV